MLTCCEKSSGGQLGGKYIEHIGQIFSFEVDFMEGSPCDELLSSGGWADVSSIEKTINGQS